MIRDVEYVRPETLEEAVSFLWEYGPQTKCLAGGTDLLIDLRAGKLRSRYVMDISRLRELKGIELTEEGISVGAGVTLSEIRDSEVLARYADCLRKASLAFASAQIRNVATIGGNVGNASPSADTLPPMIVHEAVAVLRDANGERRVPVEEMASRPYRSSVRPEEVITRFILKPAEGRFSDFSKIARRRALAIARMNMAVLAGMDREGRIDFIRIALGSSTPTPIRMTGVEAYLYGKRPDADILAEGGYLMAQKMIEISGRRPSTVYKEKAVQGLFIKLLYPMVQKK